ncbi:MAG TPA: aspartyl protease family protein [Pyrinomonadaceae bacterium]|nr:aspartyl protease family protein [Pyrinomonadaceae bacterium]
MKRIRHITLLAALTVTLAAVVAPLPEQAVFSSRVRRAPEASAPKPVVTIPFKLVTRHIVVPVKINNSRSLSFVFDTGDKVGIVDIGRAKELGLDLHGQVRIGGAGSDTLLGSYVRGATWKLQGFEDFSQPVALAIPLGRLAARFGHDFDGIIGSDFIKQFVIEVDYQARVLKLHAKDGFVYSGSGESIPIQFNSHGHPLIEAEVTPRGGQPIKGKFVLDLGSSAALALHSPLVKEHHLLELNHHTIRAIGVGGAGGDVQARIGRVSELKIGKFRITGPTALFSQDKAGAFANSSLAGNIGQRIASKFKLFLDYERHRIILEPASTFQDPFDQAQTGMALTTEGANFSILRVLDVLENSPASEAGLLKDDQILRVDDKSAPELGVTKLGELFERPGAYRLTVRRGDRTIQLTLTTRRLI